jgi:hypothetical protein
MQGEQRMVGATVASASRVEAKPLYVHSGRVFLISSLASVFVGVRRRVDGVTSELSNLRDRHNTDRRAMRRVGECALATGARVVPAFHTELHQSPMPATCSGWPPFPNPVQGAS